MTTPRAPFRKSLVAGHRGPLALSALLAWVSLAALPGFGGCSRTGPSTPAADAGKSPREVDRSEADAPRHDIPAPTTGAGDRKGRDQKGDGRERDQAANQRSGSGREPAEPLKDDPQAVTRLEQAEAALERDEEGFVVAVAISRGPLAELLPGLTRLPRLAKLSLAGSQATADELRLLPPLAGLRELDLFDTELGDEELAVLDDLPRLRRLALSGTRITDAAMPRLANLRELRELDLRWTDIRGDSLGTLADLRHLEKLDLSWTLVSDEQVEQLAQLQSIGDLVLEHTEISPEGLNRLEAELADSRIIARDSVAEAIEAGSKRDYSLIGAGVGDRVRITAQEYRTVWSEFLRRYAAATTEAERAELAEQVPSSRPFAEGMLKLAEENPDHPAAVEALCWVVQAEERFVRDLQQPAASQLLQRYVDTPGLGEACLRMSSSTAPAVHELLRSVKETSSVDEVRGRATFALAGSLRATAEEARRVQAMDEVTRNRAMHLNGALTVGRLLEANPPDLSREAEDLLEEVAEKYAAVEGSNGPLGERVKAVLFELRSLAIGREAPEIVGKDVEAETFRLSDYRGQVVVLTFWGNWCGPCRALYPRERELVERLRDEPFALLGVNSDRDRDQLRRIIEEENISWRSWWDGGGTRGPIARAWNVDRWPTSYVLDSLGVIRYKNLRGEDLDRAVDRLLAELQEEAR